MAALSSLPGRDERPLIAHVMLRFAVGGLENGVVNLINHMPPDRWRHSVVALTRVDPDFARRIRRPDVELVELNKPPGHGFLQAHAWWRAVRRLRPQIVHTRNLAALEFQLPAWLAGVPARIHGEHGRDMDDLHGTSRKHVWMRRVYMPFVHQVVALGEELSQYSVEQVGVKAERLHTIYNGVDIDRFAPRDVAVADRARIDGCPFTETGLWLVGTVGRMQHVKAQTDLAHAFVRALQAHPPLRQRLRLVLVGDGPLRAACEEILQSGAVRELAWLPGERHDVPDVMRGLDCFVLPSLAEGISNTILEAMASGLPVLATRVGANPELVSEQRTGLLVPAGDPDALAHALSVAALDPERSAGWGRQGRLEVERRFSMQAMVAGYEAVYRRALGRENPTE